MIAAAAALSLLLPLASAHMGCGGHEIGRRNHGGSRVLEHRQVANSVVDPTSECTYYTYSPWDAIKSSYPTIWAAADIVANDTEATALFATINASLNAALPDVAVKGNGDHTGNWGTTDTTYTTDTDCWWTYAKCTTPASSTGLAADITTVPEPETWGLGFDDGPNCSHNALYNFLSEQDQKATMFFIGSNVVDWPVQAIRAKDDGHEICVHTWSHEYMTSFSNQQAFAELYYTRKAIKELLGVTPKCWRPPFGDVDNRIRFIAAALNMTTIVWSEDTDDWKVGTDNVTSADVSANYADFCAAGKNGTYSTFGPVVLNHELNNYTMQEFIDVYPTIKASFKYIVPIATALNTTYPYEETNVTYPTFAQYIGGTTETNGTTASNSSSSSTSNSSTASGAAAAASTSAKSAASQVAALPVMGMFVAGLVATLL